MRQKATKAARKPPPDFTLLKITFWIEDEVKMNNIPAHLLVYWDQTGSKLVLSAHGLWQKKEANKFLWWERKTVGSHCIVSCHSIWCSSPSPVNLPG